MGKKVTLDEKGFRKFSMRDNIAYAAGDFGCNMSFALKGTLIIFWTQFMGMDSMLAPSSFGHLGTGVFEKSSCGLGCIWSRNTHPFGRNRRYCLVFIASNRVCCSFCNRPCLINWKDRPPKHSSRRRCRRKSGNKQSSYKVLLLHEKQLYSASFLCYNDYILIYG